MIKYFKIRKFFPADQNNILPLT